MKFLYDRWFIEDNVIECFESVPYIEKNKSRSWFVEAHNYCKEFANKRKLELMPVVGTLAALSPCKSWRENKILLSAYYSTIFKHTRQQIDKAHMINAAFGYTVGSPDKEYVFSCLGGRKTQAFFENILEPYDSQRVTLDRHMITISGFSVPDLTNKQYDFLEQCYQDIAKNLSLLPSELQSILWVYWRNVNNKTQD